MTEMQRQFEEWALRQKWCINKTGDTYNNTYVGCSWQAWQEAWTASRAAIVVKLPDSFWGNLSELDSAQLRLLSSSEGIRYE